MNLLCHVPNNLHGNSTITTTHHINYIKKEANCFGPFCCGLNTPPHQHQHQHISLPSYRQNTQY